MRWADIEVPNRTAAMDARVRSACYPRGTFYPLSYGASTRYHRITKAAFQLCSCRSTHSQAGFYLYARRAIANRPEPAFALLRYSFGGDRPSQTARLARFPARFHGIGVRRRTQTGWYFTDGSPPAGTAGSTPPTYPTQISTGVNTSLQKRSTGSFQLAA